MTFEESLTKLDRLIDIAESLPNGNISVGKAELEEIRSGLTVPVELSDFESSLTRTELRIYQTLQRHKGNIISGEDVAQSVGISLEAAWVYVRRVRLKMEDQPERIETIRGLGYRLADKN
jgi:DNA-binding response OmpR family regulator